MSTEAQTLTTVSDYLYGCVNFYVPEEAVLHILFERGLAQETLLTSVTTADREFLKADLYVWICMGAGRVGATSDSDNGWSHSEGGYTLSADDKDRMMQYARSVYAKYDIDFPYDDSVSVEVDSLGISPCIYDLCNNPMPHIVD